MEQSRYYLSVHPFPETLKLNDKSEFLASFGAISTREASHRSKKQAMIAGFRSKEDCNFALSLLNQITLLGHPLRASILNKDEKNVHEEQNLKATEEHTSQLDKLEAQLCAISSQLGLTQALPPHLKYKYPPPTATCLANIANAMVAVPKFYTQVCHLMNKMNLPPPFGPPVNYTKEVREAMIGEKNPQNEHVVNYENVSNSNEKNDSRIMRTPNQKIHIAGEADGDILSNLSSDKVATKESNVISEGSEDVTSMATTHQLIANETVINQGGQEPSETLVRASICAACKRPYSKNNQELIMPNASVQESAPEGNRGTSNMSESSESELESDSEQSSMSPSTLDKLKALKRPRTSKNVSVDPRKRAKLQLKTENILLKNSDALSKGKTSSEKSNIPEPFTEIKEFNQGKKLQLKIPNSLPGKSNLKMEALPGDAESRMLLTNAGMEDHNSRGPSSIDVSPSSISAADHASTATTDAGKCEASSSFGKIEIKSTEKKPAKSRENFVSLEELENNRIKESEYQVVPVLAKYAPGEPSPRLYIKNLAKSVSVCHLQRIYDRFVTDFFSSVAGGEDDGPVNIRADDTKYNVRVMQEGRMKGQAFVTLPSVAVAEEARKLTNGYILHDKPMVVAFARARPAQ